MKLEKKYFYPIIFINFFLGGGVTIMTYRSFSLIPSLNNDIFSDRFTQIDNLFSRLTGEKPINDTPAYNLVKKNNNTYELTISVPGYNPNELEVSVLNNQLIINGKIKTNTELKSNKEEINKWLHHGFKRNEFSLNFNLEHKISIKQAELEHGLLILEFCYEVPEKEKPKKISINIKTENKTNIINN